jgi:CRP/FNR family transcriptional regulator, anaerobic regulatory protein
MISPEDRLKKRIHEFVTPTPEEWNVFFACFSQREMKRNEFYLSEGSVCDRIAFICSGGFRMFYTIEGEESCKDFQFEGSFTGSLYSLLTQERSRFAVAALEDSEILEIKRDDLFALYDGFKIWERFGRLYAQQLFIYKEEREAALLLESSSQRYQNLMREHPQHLQRIPQKYLASYLGVKPESLSRIRRQLLDGRT